MEIKKKKIEEIKIEKTDENSLDCQIKISKFNEKSIMNDSEIKDVKIHNKYII